MKFAWVVIIVLVALYYLWTRRGSSGVGRMKASELEERLKSDPNSIAVIDVREPSEFKSGHISQAKNIPLGTLSSRLHDLPKDKDVVFVCRSGSRSMMASRKAQQAGMKTVYNLSGGMSMWRGTVRK